MPSFCGPVNNNSSAARICSARSGFIRRSCMQVAWFKNSLNRASDVFNGVPVFQRGQIAGIIAEIGRANYPPHDFRVAGFGKIADKSNVARSKWLSESADHTI